MALLTDTSRRSPYGRLIAVFIACLSPSTAAVGQDAPALTVTSDMYSTARNVRTAMLANGATPAPIEFVNGLWQFEVRGVGGPGTAH